MTYAASFVPKLVKQPQGCISHGFEITDVISLFNVLCHAEFISASFSVVRTTILWYK